MYWKCDVCGEIFEAVGEYHNNKHSMELVYTVKNNFYAFPDIKKEYKDVCDKCYKEFTSFINKFEGNA